MTQEMQENKPAVPGGKKRPGKKKWLLLAAVLLVIVLAFVMVRRNQARRMQSGGPVYTTAEVTRQSITRTLTSSGTLQPADSYTVTTLVSGEVLSDTFEEGDLVEEDQLLYTLDASDASTSQTQARNSYSQALRSYEQALQGKYPEADMTGTVKEIYVRNGDTVSNGTQLLKIVGDDKITMDFLFSYASTSDFYIGQPATIFINGLEGSIQGTVTGVSSGGTADGTGRVNTTVRVEAQNPGLVSSSCTASAAIGSYCSYGESGVHVSDATIITASASGKVTGMDWLAGDTISDGDRICTITGDNVDNQIENARISLENAQTNLDNAQDRLEDYEVTAPISGTVVTKTAKVGDNIEGGSSGTLCTIYDLSYLEMTMSIDELDISDVAVGQTVSVTADAVEDRTYTGVVTKVSVAGTTSGGITTYPVTVRIDETDGLRPGMNVDAAIVIAQADNVLTVPSGAVNRGNTVLVTADSPSAANAMGQEAPEGYAYVQVEIGIDDDSNVEITSGLQEGDTVAYIATSSGSQMGMMMGGMPGGMTGAMPAGGGMPGGGMGGGPSGGGPRG